MCLLGLSHSPCPCQQLKPELSCYVKPAVSTKNDLYPTEVLGDQSPLERGEQQQMFNRQPAPPGTPPPPSRQETRRTYQQHQRKRDNAMTMNGAQ